MCNATRSMCAAALVVVSFVAVGRADTLNASPGPSDNGGSSTWAIFFDLETLGPPLMVTGLRTGNNGAANAAFSVEVLVRTGTSLGGPVGSGPGSSSAGWTSLGTAPAMQGATASGVSQLIDIPDITVTPGQITGVAIRFTGVGPRYLGMAGPGLPYSVFQDANLKLTTGDARSAPFTTTGSWFQPRVLVGSVDYMLSALGGSGSATPSSVPQGCSTLLSVSTFPDPGGSTGIQVVGDLSGFGGSGTQPFTETSPGSNVFTYTLAVPTNQGTGAVTVPTTITDNESHTGHANINFTVASALAATSSTSPPGTPAGSSILLRVALSPAVCAGTSGFGVSADLSQIGGSPTQMFFDDGPGGGHGDETAGDNVFSFQATVAPGTPDGPYMLPYSASDAQGHTATGNISMSVGSSVFEIEPNDVKAQATVVAGMTSGSTLTGTTTGSSTTVAGSASADYFRVSTAAAPLGIYKHRLTLTTTGTVGHGCTIRGLTQSGGVIAAGSDAAVQTALTTVSNDLPARTVQWFGFGKQEQIYYRVTGTTTTTSPYTATLSTTSVAPVVAAQTYTPGSVTISRITGSPTDMDVWVYDSGLNAIPCLGRDSPEPMTLTSNYAAGTYYIAVTNFNFANNQASCPPETTLSGAVLDFPDAAADSSSTSSTNIGIMLADTNGHSESIPITKPGAFEIVWVRFSVGSATCTCPGDLTADTTLDGSDIAPFVACMVSQGGASCGCADLNNDQAFDGTDVALFAQRLVNSDSCP